MAKERDSQPKVTSVNEPLVLVRWRDAWFDFEAGSSGWPDEYIVQTVGYLVRDTRDIVSVAQEALPTSDWRAMTHIPRPIVQSITYLIEAP